MFLCIWNFLIAVVVLPLIVYTSYKVIYVYEFKDKLFNIFLFLLIVLLFVTPVSVNDHKDTKIGKGSENHEVFV